ncbi:MAG: redoxin domain-containing protein [Armatimonadetes bacterium]|nr:redoxin domain-containing protein [Armatimonadota bacterium]
MNTLVVCAAASGTTFAAEAEEAPRLEVGDCAPDFRASASDGKEYTLAQFRGRSAVVIAWYPRAMTGG